MIDGAPLLDVVVGLAVGAAAGALFFGGLWWTVRRLERASQPALLVLVSLVVRSAAVVIAMAALAQVSGLALLSGLLALLVVRTGLIRLQGARSDPAGVGTP